VTEPAAPPAPPKVKVGIVLPPPGDDLRGWLADGTALEAAGADALWVECRPDEDPVPVAAALAAVTYRVRLLIRIAEPVPDRTTATLERLGRGRLKLITAADVSDGGDPEGDGGDWLAVPAPENRAAWRATLVDAGARGFAGVLVPADPRMLDLLRNPDEVGDRRDLYLAQG
jgi:hypothetical protein